jgi:HK97 family phage portal protein
MILDSILGSRSIENPSVPLSSATDEWWGGDGGKRSASGIRVTPSSALTCSPMWRGMTLVCNYVGKVPLYLYERLDDDTKQRAKKHPAYKLGLRKPNRLQTAYVFKQAMQMLAIGHGNSYAYIFRKGSGAPEEVLMLDQQATYPVMHKGQLLYVTTVGNRQRNLMPEDVIHIRGIGDGFMGLSMFDKARESLGRVLAAQKFGAKFFANGARASGVLMTPGSMRPDAAQNLLKDFEKKQSGLDNAHRTILLEEGAKYQQITVNPDDAQMIETAELGIRDVANWLGVPPHKLGDSSRQGYNSLEMENQSFLDDSIDPWFVNWEQEWADKLLTEKEKDEDTHVVEFLRQALIRADMAARSVFYGNALRNRWMLPDEVRARENMNPLPNGEGKKLLDPPNASIKSQPATDPATGGKDAAGSGTKGANSKRLRQAYRRMVADAGRRMVTRVGTHAARLAADPKKFCGWLDDQLVTDHRGKVLEAFQPAMGKLAARAADDFLVSIRTGLSGLVETKSAAELPGAVEEYFRDAVKTLPAAVSGAAIKSFKRKASAA